MPAYDLNYRQYTTDGGNPDHIRRQVTNAKRHTLNITTDYNWQINKQNNLKVLAGMNRTDWESEDNWSQITNLTTSTTSAGTRQSVRRLPAVTFIGTVSLVSLGVSITILWINTCWKQMSAMMALPNSPAACNGEHSLHSPQDGVSVKKNS